MRHPRLIPALITLTLGLTIALWSNDHPALIALGVVLCWQAALMVWRDPRPTITRRQVAQAWAKGYRQGQEAVRTGTPVQRNPYVVPVWRRPDHGTRED